MTDSNKERLTDWVHINTATQLMHRAWEMILDAYWESNESGDLIGVNYRLEKLMNDAHDLTAEMQRETRQLFDDGKPTLSSAE